MPEPRAAVILAAGQGTRMKSDLPKVLHPVGGKPMLAWTVDLARAAGAERVVVVVGAGAGAVEEAARALGADVAVQAPPLGTGHAVLAAKDALAGFSGRLIVLYADTPLVRPETVETAFADLDAGASVAVLGFEPAEPGAYGRLILGPDGGLARIVEAKDAAPEELAARLCNSGVLAAPAPLLFELLGEVGNDNAKGEYYLPDVVALARARGLTASVARADETEVMGANTRADLAAAEAAFQARARIAALEGGATLTAPETVFFSHDTALGRDATVEPHVVFGPGVAVEAGARIRAFSHLEGAIVRAGAEVGPYARLRPGTVVGESARVGNFVELKATALGRGAKVSHLTYLGDCEVGAEANIGAGTITCNYDGFHKHRTVIGPGAFIGSDTALVAPVSVGAGSYTASGSVVTDDVPADALALARGRQVVKQGWAAAFRKKHGRE
ncbi:MAG: bifunctional UDP-N-acetylglucosamine diphosphorylase/glucosamine-1-phosphate N-acetyltransferase GlmU [Caulobacterales bacterium]|nr:bifunctional UDP-N-acetylglucosamine diphosphorylase/glucosamine-1-phosphate N-acetyltransferase GlmU [Caulobacterales bacterium]